MKHESYYLVGRMGKLGEWGGGRIKIWWWWWWGERGVLLEGFSQVGRMSKFSAGGRGLPPSFPVGKPIYIYIYLSASLCTDHPSKSQPSIFFFLSPEVLKNLISCPRQTKSPDNSNLLLMLNNNILISEQPAKTS